MSKTNTKDLSRALKTLMWLGALAALLVSAPYIYNFGPGHWLKLSQTPGDWGVLGDYVGGLLNPIFSFLAFIGVIITIQLQAKQLDIVREQANLEEIQRVLSTLSVRIDGLLAATHKESSGQLKSSSDVPKTVFQLIAKLGQRKLEQPTQGKTDWFSWLLTEEQIADQRQAIEREFNMLGREFETLAWTLGRYAPAGGNELVIEFYRYRYSAVLTWLDAIGLIENHEQIQSFFKPKEPNKYKIAPH